CRGLIGQEWIYAVRATPVPRARILDTVRKTLDQLHDLQFTAPLPGIDSREIGAVAKYYTNLLEEQLKRYEQGRALGVWRARVLLRTNPPSELGRGRALLHAAFTGAGALPEPLRTGLCDPRSSSPPLETELTSAELALLARPPAEEFPGLEV